MSMDVEPAVAPCEGENLFAFTYKPAAGIERPALLVPYGYPRPSEAQERQCGDLCDHCGRHIAHQRFYRMKHLPTGGWVNVSEGCLPEVLGVLPAAMLTGWVARYENFLHTIRASAPRFGREHFSVLEVITTSLCVIALRGWVSRGKASETGETPTAALVLDLLEYESEGCLPVNDSLAIVSLAAEVEAAYDGHREKGETIRDWLATVYAYERTGDAPLTDYLHNLAMVATLGHVESRHVGLLCSAPLAYEDHLAKVSYAASQPKVDPGSHYGTVGDRVNADVFVDWIENRGENEFGVSLLVHLHVAPSGERLKWWTGEGLKLDAGKQYHVRMSIKGHGEWDGVKETTVNRVAEADPPQPKAAKPRGKKGGAS